MIYTYQCTLCDRPMGDFTVCTTRTTDHNPPPGCNYAEEGEAITPDWKLISRKCARHAWKLPDEMDSCPVCEHEKKIGMVQA